MYSEENSNLLFRPGEAIKYTKKKKRKTRTLKNLKQSGHSEYGQR
jgi:hypothetical protein